MKKTAILRRIRHYLKEHSPTGDVGIPESPEVGSMPDLVETFSVALAQVKGEFYQATSYQDVVSVLKRVLSPAQPIYLARDTFPPDVDWHWLETEFSGQGVSSLAENTVVALTGATFLIAETGTIGIQSDLVASLLPEHHIVLAMTDQLYPTLEALVAQRPDFMVDIPYTTLITGPSRTADIEKTLVLGAHGPGRLTVILLIPNP